MEIMFVFHWQEIDRARKKFDFNTWVSQSFWSYDESLLKWLTSAVAL